MNAKAKPDWAPDNCPESVVQLIEHESILDRLKLRGLASADSKTVHAATERLKFHLAQARADGYEQGQRQARFLVPMAIVAGAALGAAASLIGVYL